MLAMVTSHKSTIHRAVVGLIVRTGTGRIEAERQWDRVYSEQYDRAVPGVTHTWKIGQYDFEFTKVFEGHDVDPLELIAQAHAEAQNAERDDTIRGWFRLARAISVIVIVISLIAWFL
jgi:hypothetical protein